MRARDICLAVICIGLAAPLVIMTDIFSSGPAGVTVDFVKNAFIMAGGLGVIAILAAGGASILGFSFKIPAVLSVFLGIYVFSSGLLVTLIGQILSMIQEHGTAIALIFSGVLGALLAVIGVFAALEIAGGPHEPMM